LNSRLMTGIIIAVVGILLVVAGIFMAARLFDVNLGAPEPQPTPVIETKVMVAIAASDIAAGAVLSEGDVVLSEVPIQYIPRDTIDTLDETVGRITKVDLYQGQMILLHNLADPTGQVFDIAYVISDTHVLMALPATDLMSREAIIKRGDIIDILVSYTETIERVSDTGEEEEEGTSQLVTFDAKQKLDITAIVMDIVRRDEEQEAITGGIPTRDQIVVQAYLVALDPQDALVLKYLIDIGGILDYVIRAPTSTGQFDLTPVTSEFIKELYGLQLLP
jgi:pilus assembly protein CpaB